MRAVPRCTLGVVVYGVAAGSGTRGTERGTWGPAGPPHEPRRLPARLTVNLPVLTFITSRLRGISL